MNPQEFARLEDYAEAIVRRLQLPACPNILAEIGRELAREDPDVHRIAAEASKDVSSAAMLLKTINSAWYGLAVKARSVQQAIAYLGLERTSLLMAGLLLRNVFPSTRRHAMASFWESATQLSTVFGFIAHRLGRFDRDVLHTFGLFRDAGSAVLINRFDDYDPNAVPAGPTIGPSLTEFEQARFGTDHAVIGAVLARDWSLPETMCDAILWHHAEFVLDMAEPPIAASAVEMIAISVLADRVMAERRGADSNPAPDDAVHAARRVLGLDERELADLESDVLGMLSEAEGHPQPALRLYSATLH